MSDIQTAKSIPRVNELPFTSSMTALSARIRNILLDAINAPQGPVGLAFAAVDRQGKILVSEAAGKLGLDVEKEVLDIL